ncbi:hypothetical protein NW762_003637 [Fusarium torreyae]|uniref:Uncharacterized protein n=1 Tax=Fusarium torreyae TaxID=1237075 RepID=A0A9W8VL86_9HYPO|nr:hypothetical protein NW762_003637 [Fusarium torreyae]
MSNSLKHLLNPVDEHENTYTRDSNLSLEEQQANYVEGSRTNTAFNIDGPIDLGFPPNFFDDYNGEYPRFSQYLGPELTNPLGNVPLIQHDNTFGINFNSDGFVAADPQLDINPQLDMMELDMAHMGINLDFSNDMAIPEEYQPAVSQTSTPLEDFASLDIPTETSREGSYTTTSGGQNLSQSNTTPGTSPDEDEAAVHYGMLHNVEVKLVPDDMSTIDERLQAGGPVYQYFTPTEYQKQVMLCFPDDDKHFGHLRSAVGQTLLPFISHQRVELEPLALKADLREIIQRASKSADAMVKVDINVYGPRLDSTTVGDALSDGNLWLQRSSHGRAGTMYENPHFLTINLEDGHTQTLQNMDPVSNDEAPKRKTRDDQLRKMVEDVYKTVDNTRELELVEGGDRVTRQLLRHQKEALGFMLERESGHINDKYRLWQEIIREDGKVQYKHKITKRRKDIRPEEKGGGILADDMGMGKSLSILALVMKTLDNGQEWAKQKNAEHKGRKNLTYSRSTLIVVSAALLVEEWMNEVRKHLEKGLKLVKYHGDKRPRDLEQLRIIEDSDIVVTTYHTLTTEYLVACEYLHANSRWCLSGTPIQNKLADIGSLFRFIRAESFDKASEFRKWIEIAYDHSFDSPELVKSRLVMLLEALCLRRTREVLNLPKTRQSVRHLQFNSQERDQYGKTRAIILRNMEHRLGEAEKSSQFGMFQMRLQLRILCNHGTYQKLFSWHRRSLIEEREAVIGTAGRHGEVSCVGCEQPMPVLGLDLSKKMFDDECAHVLCEKCIKESNFAGSETSSRRCPVCVRWYQAPPSANDAQDSQEASRSKKRRKKTLVEDNHEHYFNDVGHSTKIQAIVEDVRKDLWTTKSIIFSCWTRTLYLISRHLDKAKIPYLQLDGNSPLPQRQTTLSKFESEDEMPVLIMTTGTGAFGLNLTCANRIFIAELQWNPSVESQAISRAIRLGQESEVRVMRYVIEDTVEVEIRQQQEYKKQIAALGFEEDIS